MIGAIIGDLVGSVYEFNENKQNYDFPLVSKDSRITDDSCMSMAIAKAFCDCNGDYTNLSKKAAAAMREIGRAFPNAGYGWRFYDWVMYSKDGEEEGYGSWGNGAGMRVSPVGFVSKTEQEVKDLSRKVTEITHNHPEGLKGAEAIAMCIFLAKSGKSKEEIRDYVKANYYDKDFGGKFSISKLRPNYEHIESCQKSVPHAIECFLESESFEDAIRKCIYLGGDCDTTGAMAGAIAEAYYGLPKGAWELAKLACPEEYFKYIEKLEVEYGVPGDANTELKWKENLSK